MADNSPPRKPTFQIVLSGEETSGRRSEVVLWVEPGEGPPPHTHRAEDEDFTVLDGRFVIRVEGWPDVELGRGQTALGPKNMKHSFQNVSDTVGRIKITCRPAGFENSFAEYATVRALKLPPDEELRRLKEIDEKYDMVVDRDPQPKQRGDN